jgi:hypothetical protein
VDEGDGATDLPILQAAQPAAPGGWIGFEPIGAGSRRRTDLQGSERIAFP